MLRWVEEGVAPETFTAAHYTNGNATQGVEFTRPICKVGPHPSLSKDLFKLCFSIPLVFSSKEATRRAQAALSAHLFPVASPRPHRPRLDKRDLALVCGLGAIDIIELVYCCYYRMLTTKFLPMPTKYILMSLGRFGFPKNAFFYQDTFSSFEALVEGIVPDIVPQRLEFFKPCAVTARTTVIDVPGTPATLPDFLRVRLAHGSIYTEDIL